MNSYQLYNLHLALRQHFTSDYDYFKYNGKVKTTIESFEKNRNKRIYQALVKHSEPHNLLLSNMIDNPLKWIGEVNSDEGEEIWLKWCKRTQSLFYNFQNELQYLEESFNSNFGFTCDGKPITPLIIQLYLRNAISLETLTILLDLTKANKVYNKALVDDPLYQKVGLLCRKYLPFLKYDDKKFKESVRDNFERVSYQ